MLTIRRDQMQALAEEMERQFLSRLSVHARRVFPTRLGELDEAHLASLTRQTWRRAQTYGLRTERAVVWYLNAVVVLGAGFEDSPQNAWLKQLLVGDISGAPVEERERVSALQRVVFETLVLLC